MNKNLHRVVFNPCRGLLMVVAEIASSPRKSHPGASTPARSTGLPCATRLSALCTALACAWGLAAVMPALAQVVADPSAAGNQRATILRTGNGITQVNIQTPSAAGVSRNVYSQFDVQAQGVVLNNSSTSAQTQLGGWIAANPSLSAGSARVILNEVNATRPSQLHGFVEVGGQRAEVVIANPAGIQVNGGGFINASGVTLTTGTPVLNGGQLESYRVSAGQVSIQGAGLDTRDADYTHILARAVQLNAGLWAKELRVVTGANQLNAAQPTLAPVPIAASSSESKPAFALDVAALGGMYAGQIFLVGTEAGLGVNNRGTLGASAGDVVVQANGWITNSAEIRASGNVDLRASGQAPDSGVAHGIRNSGTVYAAGNTTLRAEGEVNNSQLIAAAQNLTVNAATLQDSSTSVLASGLNADGTLQADLGTQKLTLTTTQDLQLSGQVRSASDADLQASRLALNADARVSAGRDLTVNATTLDHRGELLANASLTVNVVDMRNRGLMDGTNTRLNATTARNIGTGRIYGDTLSLAAQTFSNENETVDGTPQAATLAARQRLDIGVGTLTNQLHALIFSAGDMVIGGQLNAARQAESSAQTIANEGGTLEAQGTLSASAAQIRNTNPNFAYAIQSAGSTSGKEYITGSGVYSADQVAWVLADNTYGGAGRGGGYSYGGGKGRLLPVGHAYADRKYQPYYNSGNAYVAGRTEIVGEVSCSAEGCFGGTPVDIPPSYGYSPGDPIWQLFGMSSPPAGTDASAEPSYWIALQSRLDSFRSSVNASAITFDGYRDYSQNIPVAVVTQTTPGKILSGGAMTLNASTSLLNEQSQIIAGGALHITGLAINNQALSINANAQRNGRAYAWAHFDHGCGNVKGCDYSYDAYRDSAYTQDVPRTLTLNTASSQASTPPSSQVATTSLSALPSGGNSPTNIPLLNSSLFHAPSTPSASYLVETDPRFANYRTWLSSDYMVQAAGVDPSVTQKRLGDGFYEQKLIREQVAALTGRRFLGDYTSDEQQYQALMNAGITFAQAHKLRPGIALSAAQVAQLTSDIVWLVEQSVTLPDGTQQKALVPQLYAVVREGDVLASGALLSGAQVQLAADGTLNNTDTIAGRKLVQMEADTLNNLGGWVQGERVVMAAQQDINHVGGDIRAQTQLSLSAGRDLNVLSTTTSATNAVGEDRFSQSSLDRLAQLSVSQTNGELLASAGRDLNLIAGIVQTQGKASLQAGNTLNLGTQTIGSSNSVAGGNAYLRDSTRREVGSEVRAEGALNLQAGANLNARAATVQAQGDLLITAGQDINLQAGQTENSFEFGIKSTTSGFLSSTTTSTRIQESSAQAQSSSVSGKNVDISAGRNLVSVGTQFSAAKQLQVQGGQTQAFYEALNVSQRQVDVQSSSSLLGLSLENKSSSDSRLQTTAVASRLVSSDKIDVRVGERAILQGAQLQAQAIAFTATDPNRGAELVLGSSIETTQSSHTEKNETLGVWQAMQGQGSTVQTAKLTTLDGQVSFDAGLQVTVQTGSNANATGGGAVATLSGAANLQNQIDLLSAQPGLAYLKDLQANPKVNWEQVKLIHEQWSYSQQGLTPAGAALLSIAVAAFTSGMGAELLGSTTTTATAAGSVATTSLGGITLATSTTTAATAAAAATTVTTTTALGAAINAGFSALAAQASVAMVNNGGDIGKTLAQLGSSESLRNIALSMVSAGALSELNTTLGLDKISVRDGFSANLGKNLITNLAQAGITSAITGTSLEDNIRTGLLSGLISAGAAQAAKAIGDLTVPGADGSPAVLNAAGQALAHALAGCVAGAAGQGAGGCQAGAAGAVVGELAAQWYDPNGTKNPEDTLNFVKVVSAAAGTLAGGDAQSVATAVMTGVNAAQNNYLAHADAIRLRTLQGKLNAGTLTPQEAQERQALIAKDQSTNAQLQACGLSNTSQCQAIKADFAQAQQSYLPTQQDIQAWANAKATAGPYSAAQLVDAYNMNFTKGALPSSQTSSGDLSAAADWIRGQLSGNAQAKGSVDVLDRVYMGWVAGSAASVGAGGTSGLVSNQALSKAAANVGSAIAQSKAPLAQNTKINIPPEGAKGGGAAVSQIDLAPPPNTYPVYTRGAEAAKGPLPPGYTTVSRWVSPDEASLWVQNQGTAIPAAIPRNGTPQLYVTEAGAPYPPGANGTVRIDFAVPNTMLKTGNAPNNFMILQPSSSTPIYNVNIHVPNGVTLPKPR